MYFNSDKLSNIIYPNLDKKKNIILEPLCSIIRIILLNYKDIGTKISIKDNSITYNNPNYYQPFIRNYNGDTREDLHNLYNPFIKSFEWYPKEDIKFTLFYEKCKLGLIKLIKSYDKDTIIAHTLNHYMIMFDDILNNKKISKLNNSKESPLLNNLKDFWKVEELDIVFKIIQFIDICDIKELKNMYIKIIEDILLIKENSVNDYINKSSTSYN